MKFSINDLCIGKYGRKKVSTHRPGTHLISAHLISAQLVFMLLALLWLETARAGQSLKACGHPFYPPVSWHHNNQLTGLAPAVTRQLFAELGYQVQLSADSNWKRCLLEVQQGKADIVVAAYRIRSREAYLSFSQQPIVADKVTLFVNRQQPIEYRSPEDLKGKTVGLLLGDSFGEQFDRFVEQHGLIEYVSRGHQNFAKLALGRIDYMPLGQLSGELQSLRLGFHDDVMALNTEITTEHYYLALGHHSGLQGYLPYLNQRLKQMHEDGTIQRLIQKYSFQYLNAP
ncbi:substrate-binding periplasmic protein [Oceanospirillum sediminis]|nr:transporter substrate-binding domain-containing protein [Oceanospirillum sediminis]